MEREQDEAILDAALAQALAWRYPAMAVLNLGGNGLAALQDLRALSNITDLDVSYNKLTTLDGLDGLEHLRSLKAGSNTILEVLDLTNNQLDLGPWVGYLAGLSSLGELDVRGNPVCQHPGIEGLLAAQQPALRLLNGQLLDKQPRPEADSQRPSEQTATGSHVQELRAALGQHTTPLGGSVGQGAPQKQEQWAGASPAGNEQDAMPQPWDAVAEGVGLTEHPQRSSGDWRGEAVDRAYEQDRAEAAMRKVAALQDALREAQNLNAHMSDQLHQHATTAAQQLAGLAEQLQAAAGERDAAVQRCELLDAQLQGERARAQQTQRGAEQLRQHVEELHAREQQLQAELAAAQDALVQQAEAAAVAAAAGCVGGGWDGGGGGGGARSGPGGAAVSPGKTGEGGQAQVVDALQQRVAALRRVVEMQELELLRLGGLATSPRSGVDPAATAQAARPHDNVLRPWRERVADLTEQLERMGAESVDQRAVWGQQIVGLREQFTQARTLLEVLEQRGREQRAENSLLRTRVSALEAELRAERERAGQQAAELTGHDEATQAVRRQLASFQAAVSKQMGQLEARAEQLSGYAARLGFACQRIHFALRLLAGRRPGRAGPPGSGGVQLPGGHTGRTQALLQALGGQVQAVAGALDAGQRHLPAPQGEGGSLVGVLQQEVRRLAADRDALLQQLVEAGSSVEARVQEAARSAREQAAQHREAIVAAQVQAARQLAEAEAERKVRAVEAALSAQAVQLRALAQGAVRAGEEQCRRVEAAAGVRLAQLGVRLRDMVAKVASLKQVQSRSQQAAAAHAGEALRLQQQLTRLRQEVDEAEREAARARLAQERAARLQVAELQAAHEEALAAERRRAAEAERQAAKAAAAVGQLELHAARVRETRARQADARAQRLEAQLAEQALQLGAVQRERSKLLAALRRQQTQTQQGGADAPAGSQGAPAPPDAPAAVGPGDEHDDDDTGMATTSAGSLAAHQHVPAGARRNAPPATASALPIPITVYSSSSDEEDGGGPEAQSSAAARRPAVVQPHPGAGTVGLPGGYGSIAAILRSGRPHRAPREPMPERSGPDTQQERDGRVREGATPHGGGKGEGARESKAAAGVLEGVGDYGVR